MQTIASRGAIIGQRVTARPSGKTANKSATRQPIKVNAVHTNQTGQGIMVDPDQYDPDANTGRGSGFVARAAGQQVRSSGAAFAPAGARPSRVARAPDGVTYDPDQYDPDANQRSSGNVYSPPTGQLMADLNAPAGAGQVTESEVRACQDFWASSIVDISASFLGGQDYVGLAGSRAGELYGYGNVNVLFKPTKAAQHPFRPTANEAMSYFVGHDAVAGGYNEDHGFAINAKKGFSKVVFKNHMIDCHSQVALAMGTYEFTCATTGAVSEVEYTFGYKRCPDGKVRICLHHSSIPYGGGAAAPATGDVTREDVIACQDFWAQSICDISKTYLQGGDYVGLAGTRAGELYGYGHSNVLFKPTKAAQHQFRPSASEAMSYFVGGNAVPGGYSEDGGFAINSGKGFSKVTFKNHQIDCHGDVALSMGTYDFTCATTGAVSTVEYTFGYKRNSDGKCRICLHHSSIPYGAH